MPGTAIVTVNENEWQVSIASTYAELTTGLREVSVLAAGTGMLFILLADEQAVSVDTTGMNFALDIIFIANNVVIDVARNVEPGYLVTEETSCDSFLEVNTGEAILVEAGDSVSTATIQQPGMDFSQIISFAVPLALLGFVCAMAGGMMTGVTGSSSPPRRLGKPKAEAERGETHLAKYGSKELPERGKGREKITVKCPICEKEIEVVGYDRVTRSGVLRKHLEKEHAHHSTWGEGTRFIGGCKVSEGLCHTHGYSVSKTVRCPKSPLTNEEWAAAWELAEAAYPQGMSNPWVNSWWPETREEAEGAAKVYEWKMKDAIRMFREKQRAAIESYERGADKAAYNYRRYVVGEYEKGRELSVVASPSGHHSMWLTLEQRKELEKKYGSVAVRWAEEATRSGDIKGVETAAEYYYKKIREAFGLGHLSPELSEEQIMELREVLGLPKEVPPREKGYIE